MKDLVFVSWNVNGIRAVDKKEALKWVDKKQIDFLALQEIKAQKEQIPTSIFDKEFLELHVNSSSNKGQSGVAVYSDVKSKHVDTTKDVDILDEGRINEFHFDDIAFFNVYFPNGQRNEERLEYKMAFYDRFLEYIEELKKQGKSIVICGDVNTAHTEIDIARPKANENTSGFLKMEREWIDKLLSHGYIDTFRHVHGDIKDRYSWWSYRASARKNNVGWRIDYFYVSDDLKDKILGAEIHDDILGSDHCPISLTLKR
ncbi:exodeoxyribonuclease III [Sulfurospirillum arcachonense]|uniref:exodeoxyribonuclease III n=1 Tax=Sulfurospirillum arcachonense TaxID=57666 RepID=UPI000469DA25|nr:exodeoxyribonuclease III [Sulfurospirillum arcachonense]